MWEIEKIYTKTELCENMNMKNFLLLNKDVQNFMRFQLQNQR